jgi:hypothetical protein
MKIMAKYIKFKHVGYSKSGKTKNWKVLTTDDSDFLLGIVGWFARWRKYSFYPTPHSVFEQTCLRDIATFCENETKKHKERKNEKNN